MKVKFTLQDAPKRDLLAEMTITELRSIAQRFVQQKRKNWHDNAHWIRFATSEQLRNAIFIDTAPVDDDPKNGPTDNVRRFFQMLAE